MNQKNQTWRISIIFGIASAITIILTYLKQPEDINYAGSRFAYNLTFFFPLFILSLILGVISFIYFIKYLKAKTEKNRISKIGLPILTILPIGLHLVIIIVNFVGIIIMTNFPKDHEPVFTTRKIIFKKPELTLYLHGALLGEYYKERLVYLTDKPFSETNPDTSKVYKYEGDNKVFIFYKIRNDSLDLFIPKGLLNRPSGFNADIVIKQYEYTYEEANELRKLYNENKLNQFYWSMN